MRVFKIISLTLFLCVSFCTCCSAELKWIDSGQIMLNNTNPLYDNMYSSITFSIKNNSLYKNFRVQWYYNKENDILMAYAPFGKTPLFETHLFPKKPLINISIEEVYDEKTKKIFFIIQDNNNRDFFFILGFNGKGEYLEQLFHFKTLDKYTQNKNYNASFRDNGIIEIWNINHNTNNVTSYKYKLSWNNDKFTFDTEYLGKENKPLFRNEYNPNKKHKTNWNTVFSDN